MSQHQTQRLLVEEYLFDTYPHMKTATQIARVLCLPLPSVSSLLRKMVLERVINRKNGFGPRGGFGYVYNLR